jgi:hypothetical protein
MGGGLMPEHPAVKGTLFTVFEKRSEHHHRNTGDELPDTKFSLSLIVHPEKLGVRIGIIDEYRDGTAAVDVAVLYYWRNNVSPDDDLNDFVELVAIPQVLTCASTVLIDVARTVTDDEIPFYGLMALGGMVERFRKRKRPLHAILAESIARRASEPQEQSPE